MTDSDNGIVHKLNECCRMNSTIVRVKYVEDDKSDIDFECASCGAAWTALGVKDFRDNRTPIEGDGITEIPLDFVEMPEEKGQNNEDNQT